VSVDNLKAKTMKLTDKSVEQLADTLAPQIADCIVNDTEYMDFLCPAILQALGECVGEIDPELFETLAYEISERIALVAVDVLGV
jgi:hypothetical protein